MSVLDIVNEVVVHHFVVVEEIDEQLIVTNEATGDVWVEKVLVNHGIVVNLEFSVEVDFRLHGLRKGSLILAKNSEFEDTVVEVGTGE